MSTVINQNNLSKNDFILCQAEMFLSQSLCRASVRIRGIHYQEYNTVIEDKRERNINSLHGKHRVKQECNYPSLRKYSFYNPHLTFMQIEALP